MLEKGEERKRKRERGFWGRERANDIKNKLRICSVMLRTTLKERL